MSGRDDWHVPVDRIERYERGESAPTERDSIESHLLTCELCRTGLAASRQPAPAAEDAVLRAVMDRIDRPRRPLAWGTGALQVSLASPQLIAATAGLAAVLLVAVGGAAAAEPRLGVMMLIALAPLAPAAAAVAAFWPASDPAGSLSAATPLAGGKLPFLRALFASVVSALAGLLCSAFTPLGWSESIAWLAPGFAFAALVIAAATWADPRLIAAGVGLAWLTMCSLWSLELRRSTALEAFDDLATNTAAVQLGCAAVIALATFVALHRRDARPNWRTA